MSCKVIVIGGGASGVFAAGYSAEKGAKVLLIEKNNRLCRKLLITGKGRCNLTNIGEIKDFIDSYGKNGKFLYRAFREFFNKDLIAFFRRYGIRTRVEHGGRVFPVSDDSRVVFKALTKYLGENNVQVKLNSRVEEIVVGGGSTVLKSIKNVVKNLLPGKLVPVFIELIGIPEDKKSNQITRTERNRIVDFLTDFRLEILKLRPISEALVTRGGIPLTEINPYNMESKLVKGLYFCGEIIDIDGITGGYNLQSAFSTGYLAGNV